MNDSSTPMLGATDFPVNANNPLAQYIQALPKDTVARMHQPDKDAAKLMEGNVMGMLGALPGEFFDVNITTSRQALGQLMASAMVYGYFLHTAEHRMELENILPQSDLELDSQG